MSSFIKKIQKGVTNPRFVLDLLAVRLCSKWLQDKPYLKMRFKLNMGYPLDLDNPRTFNEKMSWIKLYDRRPVYTQMADKYTAKQFVSERVGKEYVVENLAQVNKWEDIDINALPNQFVIKCTHDSSGVSICKDKSSFDFEKARKKIEQSYKCNYFWNCREWPYKNIQPKIIIDRYLDDHTGNELRDYKFWCFNGKPVYMYCTIKGKGIFENFYDMDFNIVPIDHGFPRNVPEFNKPNNFELMKELATKLSDGVPFVRVDFFDVEGKVYFGEFTFFDWGGLRPFNGDWDEKLGELLQLPKIKTIE